MWVGSGEGAGRALVLGDRAPTQISTPHPFACNTGGLIRGSLIWVGRWYWVTERILVSKRALSCDMEFMMVENAPMM